MKALLVVNGIIAALFVLAVVYSVWQVSGWLAWLKEEWWSGYNEFF